MDIKDKLVSLLFEFKVIFYRDILYSNSKDPGSLPFTNMV